MPIIAWVFSNFKLILISAGVIALMFFVWKAYDIVNENAFLKSQNQIQQISIKNQVETIAKLKLTNDLRELYLKQRDQEIDDLNNQLEDILVDLGGDATDQAPSSLKELFKRLNG